MNSLKMNKFYSMIGIAKKSGNIAIGYDASKLIIVKRKSFLVIIAENASEKTKKNIIYLCNNNCKYIIKGDKNIYGTILSKKSVSVLAISNKNIASYLINNN